MGSELEALSVLSWSVLTCPPSHRTIVQLSASHSESWKLGENLLCDWESGWRLDNWVRSVEHISACQSGSSEENGTPSVHSNWGNVVCYKGDRVLETGPGRGTVRWILSMTRVMRVWAAWAAVVMGQEQQSPLPLSRVFSLETSREAGHQWGFQQRSLRIVVCKFPIPGHRAEYRRTIL